MNASIQVLVQSFAKDKGLKMNSITVGYLQSFVVGEYRYIEIENTNVQKQLNKLTIITCKNRVSEKLVGYSFKQSVFTSVARKTGEAGTLIRIERLT